MVRRLTREEIPSALNLAWKVFSEYESPDYSAEGTEEFRRCLNDGAYLRGIDYYGAFDGHRLIGMLGVRRETCHVCFCFVDGPYHRRGVGTGLFKQMAKDFPGRTFTVNSSPFGLPFYRALGFTAAKNEQTVNGIRFTPMEYRRTAVVYVPGKGGSAAESEHFRPLFPDRDVIGLACQAGTPWEAEEELRAAFTALGRRYDGVTLIANSIGAFFCMYAQIGGLIRKAYFISPIVDMEKLITDMMRQADVSEAELRSRGTVRTAFGEDLSWEYLCRVRSHSVLWDAPTEILYGSRDALTSYETVRRFAETCRAGLTVMQGGEHWFHTSEQLRFLDAWIREKEASDARGVVTQGETQV